MKTALAQYIIDINNGTCKGEEYYLELEKHNIIIAYDAFDHDVTSEEYFNETYTNDK